MKFPIKIKQILEGHVVIDADSLEEALQKADQKYNREGHELPDMDDVNPLKFESAMAVSRTGSPLFAFIEEEVPYRFKEVFHMEVDQDVLNDIIDELIDNNDVMFDYDKLDSWLMEKYDELTQDGPDMEEEVGLDSYVKDWYTAKFPSDSYGDLINDALTFGDVLQHLNNNACVTFGDSVVRERIFGELAEIMDVDYMDIYHKWLRGPDAPAIGEEEVKVEVSFADKLQNAKDRAAGAGSVSAKEKEPATEI